MNTVDLTKTPIQNMIALVNRSSGVEFTEADLSFSLPTPKTPTTTDPTNTIITISANPSSPVQGTRNAKYKRLHLANDFNNSQSSFNFTPGTSISVMADTIKTTIGIHPTTPHVAELVTPTRLKLKASDTDYLYIGEQTYTLFFN